jgi:hypothetical protein
MIQIALISNNGNNVGVVGSDTATGRVVYKFSISPHTLGRVIDEWLERSIVSESEESDENGRFILRTRVTTSEKDYLPSLLARAVNPPFYVRYIEEFNQGNVSDMVLKDYNELM